MSYLVVSLILSFLFGFLGMLIGVQLNSPADNPFRVVWGSIAFWAGTAGLAWFTVGWPSALASVAGGFLLIFLFGRPGDITFTWGRALIRIANAKYVTRVGPLAWPLRFIGVRLQNFQVPLNKLWRR